MSDALAIPDKVSSAQGKWCQPFFLDNFQVERIILAQTEVGGDMKSHTVLIILGVSLFLSEAGVAQEKQVSAKLKDAVSCNEFAAASKQMMGKSVGVEECRIISERPYSISRDISFAESRCVLRAPSTVGLRRKKDRERFILPMVPILFSPSQGSRARVRVASRGTRLRRVTV